MINRERGLREALGLWANMVWLLGLSIEKGSNLIYVNYARSVRMLTRGRRRSKFKFKIN